MDMHVVLSRLRRSVAQPRGQKLAQTVHWLSAGFTTMSKDVEPVQVMRFLNELFTQFDQGNSRCLQSVCPSETASLPYIE
jgi:hypothetical protein